MTSLSEALGERVGPFPAWLWALGIGGGLYAWARWRSSGSVLPSFPVSNTTTPLDSGGGGQLLGSPAALAGPVLELNPMQSSGINPQPGAALAPGSIYIPNPVPQVSGGDIPTVGGYAGIGRGTSYDRARGGPS